MAFSKPRWPEKLGDPMFHIFPLNRPTTSIRASHGLCLSIHGNHFVQQEYARLRHDAQLQDAERQRWLAEQQRIQAEQAARENRIPSFQGALDSQAEISRKQQMWAEQQKRDAEMRALQFP